MRSLYFPSVTIVYLVLYSTEYLGAYRVDSFINAKLILPERYYCISRALFNRVPQCVVRVDSFINAKLIFPERYYCISRALFNRVPQCVVRVDSFVNAKLILPERKFTN